MDKDALNKVAFDGLRDQAAEIRAALPGFPETHPETLAAITKLKRENTELRALSSKLLTHVNNTFERGRYREQLEAIKPL